MSLQVLQELKDYQAEVAPVVEIACTSFKMACNDAIRNRSSTVIGPTSASAWVFAGAFLGYIALNLDYHYKMGQDLERVRCEVNKTINTEGAAAEGVAAEGDKIHAWIRGGSIPRNFSISVPTWKKIGRYSVRPRPVS